MNIEKARAMFSAQSDFTPTAMPVALAALDDAGITDVDVREDLHNGIEPFGRIMQAQAAVATGAVMRVRATFEPLPLYAVLGKQGFSHWTERFADDDWRVWFYRGELGSSEPAVAVAPAVAPATTGADADLVIIDVRGLEPPLPMTRTIDALNRLGAGQSLLQVNARIPQFLLPLLHERGFEYVLVDEQPGEVRGMIRRITSA